MKRDRNNSIVSTASNVNLTPIVVDYNISQITPYVFVTAGDTARQFPQVFSNGISCVINVAHELPQIYFPPESGIESLKYPIEDNPTFPASNFFDVVADRIAANVATNRRTLLYCHHGRSRSVTFILAYLIKHHRLPLPTAFGLVKQRRQLALPNVGFWSQLRSYELYQQQQYQQPQPQPQQYKEKNSLGSNTYQYPVSYGQQMFNKISDGMERVLAQVPLLNAFVDTIRFPQQKSKHRSERQRLPVYSYPYYSAFPPGIFQMI